MDQHGSRRPRLLSFSSMLSTETFNVLEDSETDFNFESDFLKSEV